MISKNKYLLVYGGKNDNAFQYKAHLVHNFASRAVSPRLNNVIYDEITNSSLDDILLFDLQEKVWTAVA